LDSCPIKSLAVQEHPQIKNSKVLQIKAKPGHF
jgi:hypothetical protein